LFDFVCIIWAMPKKPFLRALFRRVRVNIKNG
jgi:lycopene beta-cyclase